MFGEKVIELLKESERNRETLDQYNDEKIRQIIEEMHVLFKLNMNDAYLVLLQADIIPDSTVNKSLQLFGRTVARQGGRIVREVREDMLANATTENKSLWTTVQVRHSALERNKRCLLAYLYDRTKKIKTLRWEFGSVLPPDIRELLSDSEYEWFSKYSTTLATYMRSLGQDIGYSGIDLTENLRPPKSLYIEVLCVTDYGKLELEDGDVIMLKRNSRHFLPTSECQTLIRQGILKQIT